MIDIVARLRTERPTLPLVRDAADHIEAQAREIARLRGDALSREAIDQALAAYWGQSNVTVSDENIQTLRSSMRRAIKAALATQGRSGGVG
jgi:hypothetical protein